MLIPEDITLSARYDRRLLGGAVVLDGRAFARSAQDWDGRLYRDFQPAPPRLINIHLIPYFLWDNRGQSEMTVWMPETARITPPR